MASPGHGRATSLGRYSRARSTTSRPTVHDMPNAAIADTIHTQAELSLLEWGAPLFHMSVRQCLQIVRVEPFRLELDAPWATPFDSAHRYVSG
jgi:hypothetical protein